MTTPLIHELMEALREGIGAPVVMIQRVPPGPDYRHTLVVPRDSLRMTMTCGATKAVSQFDLSALVDGAKLKCSGCCIEFDCKVAP